MWRHPLASRCASSRLQEMTANDLALAIQVNQRSFFNGHRAVSRRR
jgi:hypothetical protein